MRRLTLAFLASTALSLGAGGIAGDAFAADMAIRKAPPPLPPPVWNWTGFYFGAHLGGAWGRKEWTETCIEECGSALRKTLFDATIPIFDFEGVPPAIGDRLFDAVALIGDHRGAHTITGPLAGVQLGFNLQSGPVLFGIEGQFSWARLKGSHQNALSAAAAFNDVFFAEEGCGFSSQTELCRFRQVAFTANGALTDRFSTRVKHLGTIAARLGLVTGPQDRVLAFVKFGGAYASEDYLLRNASSANACLHAAAFAQPFEFGGPVGDARLLNVTNACGAANVSTQLSGSKTRFGGMVGIGLEFGIWDNVTAKVEYNYLAFGTKKVTLKGTGTADIHHVFGTDSFDFDVEREFKIKQDIQLIKFGVNYLFNWGAAPIAARY